ncbi:hypothetical protein M405DRAFT_821290 [Rhizopogon salebrosus TDB-379]|nr:hypothetical protein M405DRAFT_821290 [Rhizopogon salebrosus TDB-379]
MRNGITPPGGLDRHCASSSSSHSCNIMDGGHILLLWFKETAHCISMLLSYCACEGEAWPPEGRLRL